MFSLRSIFFRPKKSEYPLAKFFYADLELRRITTDLDSFDGSKDPVRCQKLIERLRKTQQGVMEVLWGIVRSCLPEGTRACRQYRDKFPEELRGDHMSGPLWFGAECLAAGSSVLHHEEESDELRPLARHITKVLETMRAKLREQCLRDVTLFPEEIVDALRWFDYNWAEFEFSYVSRMCPVKTTEELYQQHLVTILFSETTAQALKEKLISEEQMSSYDPVLMLAIPRLSILSGLEVDDGILDLNQEYDKIPTYFRPHMYILSDVKKSLSTLSTDEKDSLKCCLAASLDPHQLQSDQKSENLQCLYLAISSIADQMISNHAKDLRQMLHHTFKMNQPLTLSDEIIVTSAKTDMIHELSTAMDYIEPSTSGDTRHDGAAPNVLEGDNCTAYHDNTDSHLREEGPVWVPDHHVTRCGLCEEHFSLLRRKHHCRYCGQIFCCNCTRHTAVLSFTKSKQPVRMCDVCYKHHQMLQRQESESSSAAAVSHSS